MKELSIALGIVILSLCVLPIGYAVIKMSVRMGWWD